MKNALRWIAMPFAAIIGGAIAYALISLWIKGNSFGYSVYNGTEVGSITDILLAIAAQAVFGAAFVFCGAITAPMHRKICAVVLSTIISIVSIASMIWMFSMTGFSFLQMIHFLATCGGAIGVAYYFMTGELWQYESKSEVSMK